jgi:glycosyltransferase involved in cell wall biosynthesis
MASKPYFSVVLSTYGRGKHIRPTIESVLGQKHDDFELIVVGDGCTDETEAVVRSFANDKIIWRNLPANTGSQSLPNSEGIRSARGDWICYLGHDDIWSPDHLSCLARVIRARDDSDFVVSGCIYYGPEGSGCYFITGLFESSDAAFHHFFPPTSLAHQRNVTERIGDWRDPRKITLPVDGDFLLRAAHAGMRFTSTGRITAHKFAAGHRYLSYLRPDCADQRAMWQALRTSPEISFDEIVTIAKRDGRFMTSGYSQFTSQVPGFNFQRNRENKGINLPPLQPLRGRTVIQQTGELRALDWYSLEYGIRPYRWSGPNPRPKILIPFSGARARIEIEVIGTRPGMTRHEQIALYVEGRKADRTFARIPKAGFRIVAEIALNEADYTVLTLESPMFFAREYYGSGDPRYLGITVGDVVVEPLPPPRIVNLLLPRSLRQKR